MKRLLVPSFYAAMILSLIVGATARAGGRPLSRKEFAEKMAQVKEGMPEAEVRALLGKPDDVRTCDELRGTTARTRSIWCYGTNGHLTFPTLGCVYIDTKGKAQYIFGGEGRPPGGRDFSEDELRELLRLIDQAPPILSSWFNPRQLIQIVNTLQPLGKERALTVIDEYLRVASSWHSDAREGLFLVLRVLFDVPEDVGFMPQMHIGAPWPPAPDDAKALPRFPLLLEEDIPILLVSGYSSGGSGSVEEDVEYFRDKGRLRARPLMPPNEPLALFGRLWDKLTKSYRNPSESLRNVDKAIQDQLLRLTYSIYRKKGLRYRGDGAEFFGYRDKDFKWERAITDVARLMPRWNAAKFSYTFPDGSMLPAPPRYAKAIWKPTAFGLEPMLTIERQDRAKVNILLAEPPTRVAEGIGLLRVYSMSDNKLLAEFKAGPGRAWRSHVVEGIDLLIGKPVQAKLVVGKQELVSPVLRP